MQPDQYAVAVYKTAAKQGQVDKNQDGIADFREEVPADNQSNLEATIHRAVELGINHIETARGYGTSEMQLGRILPALPRGKIIVQTKVGPKATAEEFLRTFETSMKYLRLDYVDLLALHGVNNH